ncbi:MAG: hypothetical protein PHD76_05225 [Methylacidiphilales bacterium]|nr:hypothetical protein [Candidatus Methylacidiphilales bacterium]
MEKELRAKGERLTLDELLPPPVPDEQNVAAAPIFKELFPDNKDARLLKLKLTPLPGKKMPSLATDNRDVDLTAWQEALTGVRNEKTAAQDILKYLSQYDSLTEELRVALDRPYAQWPFNKKDPYATQVPHVGVVLNTAKVLALSAGAEQKIGNSDKALHDLKLIFRLCDSACSNRTLIGHLVALVTDSIGLGMFQTGLFEHSWSDTQLAEVQTLLHNKTPLLTYQESFRIERASFNQYTRLPSEEQANLFSSIPDESNTKPQTNVISFPYLFLRLRPQGWTDFDRAFGNETIQKYYIAAIDPKNHRVFPSMIRAENHLVADSRRNLLLTACYRLYSTILILPALDGIVIRTSQYQTLLSEADIVCALERYRLKYHTLPDSLQALVPAYLDSVPHDIINGQPLIYKRVGEQDFILYSVGWNEKDDGGVVNKKHKDQGDWVWASKPELYHTVE